MRRSQNRASFIPDNILILQHSHFQLQATKTVMLCSQPWFCACKARLSWAAGRARAHLLVQWLILTHNWPFPIHQRCPFFFQILEMWISYLLAHPKAPPIHGDPACLCQPIFQFLIAKCLSLYRKRTRSPGAPHGQVGSPPHTLRSVYLKWELGICKFILIWFFCK